MIYIYISVDGCLHVHVRASVVLLFLDAYWGLLWRRGSNGFHSPGQQQKSSILFNGLYIFHLDAADLLELF